MKKLILIAAVGVLALTGCTSTGQTQQAVNDAVGAPADVILDAKVLDGWSQLIADVSTACGSSFTDAGVGDLPATVDADIAAFNEAQAKYKEANGATRAALPAAAPALATKADGTVDWCATINTLGAAAADAHK